MVCTIKFSISFLMIHCYLNYDIWLGMYLGSYLITAARSSNGLTSSMINAWGGLFSRALDFGGPGSLKTPMR
jgi:hypothetical protein